MKNVQKHDTKTKRLSVKDFNIDLVLKYQGLDIESVDLSSLIPRGKCSKAQIVINGLTLTTKFEDLICDFEERAIPLKARIEQEEFIIKGK